MSANAQPGLPERLFERECAPKYSLLLSQLNALSLHHYRRCDCYRQMVDVLFGGRHEASAMSDVPWVPAGVFKRMDLLSVPRDQVVKVLTSSGTSGLPPSRIFLDAAAAEMQARTLTRIAEHFLGKGRKPMIVIDDRGALQRRAQTSARSAGILGFSILGRNHFHLLNEALEPDWEALQAWLRERPDQPVLLFGFTFVVWQSFVQAACGAGISLRFPAGSALVHGGGWKRLQESQVSPSAFKAAIRERFGIERIHNYYGLVEQMGSVFFECEHGHLHAPDCSDILTRSPESLEPAGEGRDGLIQVLSALPRSYPGHSILTEDIGRVLGVDNCRCGRRGKYFVVYGRLKNAEVRGCSDTRVQP